MRKHVIFQILLIVSVLFFVKSVVGENEKKTWNIDVSHTKILFTVKHMVISSVTGDFKAFGGKVVSNGNDFTDAEFDVSIEVGSINTDSAKRDGHLKSDHFFDVANYPNITFKSKSVKKVGEGVFKIVGDFTIHGVTKTEELDMDFGGTIKDPWGNERAGLKIAGKINRFDYGLKWNDLLETGGAMVGKSVDILCNTELVCRPK